MNDAYETKKTKISSTVRQEMFKYQYNPTLGRTRRHYVNR